MIDTIDEQMAALEARHSQLTEALATAEAARDLEEARCGRAQVEEAAAEHLLSEASQAARRKWRTGQLGETLRDPEAEAIVRQRQTELQSARDLAAEFRGAHASRAADVSTITTTLRGVDNQLEQLRAEAVLEARTPEQAQDLVAEATQALAAAQQVEDAAQRTFAKVDEQHRAARAALLKAGEQRQNAAAELRLREREAQQIGARARSDPGTITRGLRQRILAAVGAA